MSNLFNSEKYYRDLQEYSDIDFINWNKLKNKTVLITGTTGLIGRYLIDLVMFKNKEKKINCHVLAIGRNIKKAKEYFKFFDDEMFTFISHDVCTEFNYDGKIDFIIHCASNTSPTQYATDPIGTINTNVLGTMNLLNLSIKKKVKKFVLVSSFEVYGKVDNKDIISEHDYGVVDNTILRSCYPESKRLSETLCIAYSEQKKVNTSIVRLSRVFGPTMNVDSTLSLTQFIKAGLNHENIILKSDGTQLYSYNYVGDAVSAIIKVMIDGENKEAYNVSDSKFDGMLKDFAQDVADCSECNLSFDLPNEIKGFSNSVMTILNSDKLHELGWHTLYNLKERICKTIEILREKR